MKTKLPTEAHDHFRKANALHRYVTEHLDKATEYAIEVGRELMAAKKNVSHGMWEDECDRLFDGSARTARFYMEFARHFDALPKRQRAAVLMLEGTLYGAARAVKEAAKGHKSNGSTATTVASELVTESSSTNGCAANESGDAPAAVDTDNRTEPDAAVIDYGKCPNCGGRKWADGPEGVACERCHHPHGEAVGDVDDDRVKIQRSKTVKTAEALLRAFDDLQAMMPKTSEHRQAVAWCKALLKLAKDWT